MTKQQLDLYIQLRLRSARISAQCDQSLMYAHWVVEISRYFHASRMDVAQADLSLRWAHVKLLELSVCLCRARMLF